MSVTAGTFTGAFGTLVLNADGTYTYTPFASNQSLAQGQSVTDSFSYTVSDGACSDTATLTITIAGVNDAPVANTDTGRPENSPVTINVLANDTDVDNGAVLTVVSASAPSGQGTRLGRRQPGPVRPGHGFRLSRHRRERAGRRQLHDRGRARGPVQLHRHDHRQRPQRRPGRQ